VSAARERAGRESDLKVIYLGPNTPDGRMWCEDDVWPELGSPDEEKGTPYFRAASLDENDAALVEAIAYWVQKWLDEPEEIRTAENIATDAIIAARNHITGEGA
jgi:hypothetical protein